VCFWQNSAASLDLSGMGDALVNKSLLPNKFSNSTFMKEVESKPTSFMGVELENLSSLGVKTDYVDLDLELLGSLSTNQDHSTSLVRSTPVL